MYEFQVDRMTPELQHDFEQYIAEGFAGAFLGAEDEADADDPGERHDVVPTAWSAATTTRGS